MEAYNFLRKKYFIPPEKSLNEFSAPTFADWDSLVKLLEEYSCQIEPLVMPMFAEVIKNFGEDCPCCDNSGQIIHGYSGDSLADLEMCEFCYTTPKSKFNLYNEIEKVINASKHSA